MSTSIGPLHAAVENLLESWGVDELLGCEVSELADTVLLRPSLLLDFARNYSVNDLEMAELLAFAILDDSKQSRLW